MAAIALAIAFVALAAGLYAALVDRDGERLLEAAAPGEIAAVRDPDAFRRQLTAHLASRPRDGRAWVALARLDMDGDRFDDAAKHYAKAIEVSTKIARDPAADREPAGA